MHKDITFLEVSSVEDLGLMSIAAATSQLDNDS